MSKVTVSRNLSIPADRAWEVLADFSGIHRFHPAVEHSPLLGEQNGGLGAERRCDFYDGNSVTERVIGWEDGKSMTIEVTEGSMPLACAEGTLSVEPRGTGSRVTMAMVYKPKYGPFGAIMDTLMMRPNFRKLLARVLEGMEIYATTGLEIGKDGKPIAMAAQ